MRLSQIDQEIVDGIIKRDEETLLRFYQKYKLPISHFVYRQLHDQSLAEEITQDVFMDFIERIRDFQYQSTLKTYLYSIARNKVVDVIRKKKIKKILFSSLPSFVVEGLKTVLIDEDIEKRELARKIKNVFQRLPNDYRLVLRLKYIEEEKVKAIAKKLSLRFKATESLIFRARKAFIKVFTSLP
jgi:RNA polymerase sigma-70 factor, ECF subfamily